MEKHRSSGTGSSVLSPTIPANIGEASQRARIVEAMIHSCAEKSYPATTITDIVAGARISRTTFYKRFADKRECFDASVDRCLDELREVAREADCPAEPPADAVRLATIAVLTRMAERPALAQLLTGDAVAVDPGLALRYRGLLIPALEGAWTRAGRPVTWHTDPHLAFGRAQLLIFNQIVSGHSDQLLSLLPEMVYLAVAPLAGHEEGLVQARLARSQSPSPATKT